MIIIWLCENSQLYLCPVEVIMSSNNATRALKHSSPIENRSFSRLKSVKNFFCYVMKCSSEILFLPEPCIEIVTTSFVLDCELRHCWCSRSTLFVCWWVGRSVGLSAKIHIYLNYSGLRSIKPRLIKPIALWDQFGSERIFPVLTNFG